MLLPLPAVTVRALSLESHTALAAVIAGHATAPVVTRLLKTLYLTWFLQQGMGELPDMDTFRTAEAALALCSRCVREGREWRLAEAGRVALCRILALNDHLLASAPAYCHAEATRRLRMLATSRASSSDLR
ncbi:hypothetical protein [Paraburkholderia kururiensis]|uniref:Uncharacterized protein n=1 Tax=Paraburkholderia kururiensis TaxID=984307 RepID=A0ABZ0WHU9_9BURK|nr:hypothetical protein [Paraburkholderia kururiensis]WQD76911.1 hypothetical protein U0042_22960 [Paraburkholderia kururiensis]